MQTPSGMNPDGPCQLSHLRPCVYQWTPSYEVEPPSVGLALSPLSQKSFDFSPLTALSTIASSVLPLRTPALLPRQRASPPSRLALPPTDPLQAHCRQPHDDDTPSSTGRAGGRAGAEDAESGARNGARAATCTCICGFYRDDLISVAPGRDPCNAQSIYDDRH